MRAKTALARQSLPFFLTLCEAGWDAPPRWRVRMRYGLLIRLAALLHRLAGLSGPSRAPLTTASISTPKKPLRPPSTCGVKPGERCRTTLASHQSWLAWLPPPTSSWHDGQAIPALELALNRCVGSGAAARQVGARSRRAREASGGEDRVRRTPSHARPARHLQLPRISSSSAPARATNRNTSGWPFPAPTSNCLEHIFFFFSVSRGASAVGGVLGAERWALGA